MLYVELKKKCKQIGIQVGFLELIKELCTYTGSCIHYIVSSVCAPAFSLFTGGGNENHK